MAMAKLR